MSKLLDSVRHTVGLKHYSLQTEQLYVYWIKKYIHFHNVRHPQEMREAEVREFLTYLAVQEKVSASTQNQAFFTLLFLYRDVLKIKLPKIEDVVRAKRPEYLPVVFTPTEAKTILGNLIQNKSFVKCPLDA